MARYTVMVSCAFVVISACISLSAKAAVYPEETERQPSQQRRRRGASHDYLINGLQCADIPGVCKDSLGQVICQLYCPEDEGQHLFDQCVDHIIHEHLTCKNIPGVCDDAISRIICRGTCINQCEHTTAPRIRHDDPCPDVVGYGLWCDDIPMMCTSSLAAILCPKTCGLCPSTTQSVATTTPVNVHHATGCQDNVGLGLSCPYLPGICNSSYASLVCPAFCDMCPSSTTAPPTTPTTLPPATTTATTHHEVCEDKTDPSVSCAQLPNVCATDYAEIVCPKYCGYCASSTTAPLTTPTTLPPATTTATTHHEVCRDQTDASVSCAQLPNVCATDYAEFVCPKYCGYCASSATAPPTTPTTLPPATTTATTHHEVCEDKTDPSVSCAQLPNVCATDYAEIVCPKYCGYCGCEDNLSDDVTCEDLMEMLHMTKEELCGDSTGKQACSKFCGCPRP